MCVFLYKVDKTGYFIEYEGSRAVLYLLKLQTVVKTGTIMGDWSQRDDEDTLGPWHASNCANDHNI